MVGTDSHTPNAGGLGMVAIGVGGADAVDVMTGFPFNVRWPKLIGVHLTGELNGWSAPKDVILKVAEILTVKGGTGAIVEYFGPGANSISCTGKATICNMGAEIGATTSVFAYDDAMARYLKATGREEIADAADRDRPPPAGRRRGARRSGPATSTRSSRSTCPTLRPHINGPHTPDLAREVSGAGRRGPRAGMAARDQLGAGRLVHQLLLRGHHPCGVDPALRRGQRPVGQGPADDHPRLRAGARHDRARRPARPRSSAAGATVLANACGPCIGQWVTSREDNDHLNTIVTSYNRNFPKRNDGSANTLAFVTSPETVVALALPAPSTSTRSPDTLTNEAGEQVRTARARRRSSCPSWASPRARTPSSHRPRTARAVEVKVSPTSDRLQLLEPFAAWDGEDYLDLPILVKAKGKCTTDHISMAGPWLKYRGHLENISGNLFLGAINAFTGAAGEGKDVLDGTTKPYPDIAEHYHEAGQAWVAVGDENWGEGSSREHAAMEPRFRGCKAIIVRSFARIHEANLKKQGVLALTFADPDDLRRHRRGRPHQHRRAWPTWRPARRWSAADPARRLYDRPSSANQTMSEEHIEWFRAGSALNIIRARTT